MKEVFLNDVIPPRNHMNELKVNKSGSFKSQTEEKEVVYTENSTYREEN